MMTTVITTTSTPPAANTPATTIATPTATGTETTTTTATTTAVDIACDTECCANKHTNSIEGSKMLWIPGGKVREDYKMHDLQKPTDGKVHSSPTQALPVINHGSHKKYDDRQMQQSGMRD